MKKVAKKLGTLSFPKAPTAIGECELAKATGGTTTTVNPCWNPIPCIRPVAYVPCVRPGEFTPCVRPA